MWIHSITFPAAFVQGILVIHVARFGTGSVVRSGDFGVHSWTSGQKTNGREFQRQCSVTPADNESIVCSLVITLDNVV